MKACGTVQWLSRAWRVAQTGGARIGAHAAFALALSIVATWPSANYLATRVYKGLYTVDANGGLWWPHAFVHSLLRGEYPFWARSLVWPDGQDVTPMIWNYGVALLFSPVYLLADPILAANLVAFGIMVLNGLAAGWAARVVTGSRRAGVAALIVGATSPYAWIEAGSGRQDQALWAPVAIYLACLVLVARRREGRRWIFAAAASLAAAGAIYWFYAYFLVLVTLVAACIVVVTRRQDVRFVKDLAWVGGGAFVLVLPFLAPVLLSFARSPDIYYRIAEHVPGTTHQQVAFSLAPSCFSGVLGLGRHDGNLQASLLLVPASLWAAIRGRGAIRALGLVALAAACLACGPYLAGGDGAPIEVAGRWVALPMRWLGALPGFDRFWWPYRWLAVALPAFAVSVGWGVSRVGRTGWVMAALAGFLVVEAAVVLRLDPGRTNSLWPAQRVPEVFEELAKQPWPAPILLAPMGMPAIRNTVWQAFLGQPIDMGLDWHIPGLVTEGWRQRRREVPLLAAIDRAMSGVAERRRVRWSPEAAGGFHYVLLAVSDDPGGAGRRALDALLGEADFVDCDVVVWHVPGVGVPLRVAGSEERCESARPGHDGVSPGL